MEAGKNILGDSDGEQQACSTGDTLADSDDEDQRKIFSNSAFSPVKFLAECSPSLPNSQVLSPPPFLSSPGWYSSLLSSLSRTGTEQNNNLEQDREGKKENAATEGKGYKI